MLKITIKFPAFPPLLWEFFLFVGSAIVDFFSNGRSLFFLLDLLPSWFILIGRLGLTITVMMIIVSSSILQMMSSQ